MDSHEQNKRAVTSELSNKESALDLEFEDLGLNLSLVIYYYLQHVSLLGAQLICKMVIVLSIYLMVGIE